MKEVFEGTVPHLGYWRQLLLCLLEEFSGRHQARGSSASERVESEVSGSNDASSYQCAG